MNFEEALAESGVVAIIRGVTPSEAGAVGEALHQAGVRVVEVPLNSPEPYESIDRLATSSKAACSSAAAQCSPRPRPTPWPPPAGA